MYDFITFGSATRDVFIRSSALKITDSKDSPTGKDLSMCLGSKIEISDLNLETGGGASNAAVTFGKLGYKTSTIISIGQDPSGRDVLEVLESNGVKTNFVQKHPTEQTAFAVILLTDGGERTILVYRGAAEHLSSDKISWPELKSKWFYITSMSGNLEMIGQILKQAEQCGAKVMWNPGSKELKQGIDVLKPLIQKIDILNLNLEEAKRLLNQPNSSPKEVLDELKDISRLTTVVTDGVNGAYFTDKTDSFRSDIIDCPRVNVTGAGDAFGSGLVAGLEKTGDLKYAVACGTWNATGVVQITGAKKGILESFPSNEDITKVKIEKI